MKTLITLIGLLAAFVCQGQTTINLSVTLDETQVWALTQDWNDYRAADPTNNTLTKLQWFTAESTNKIHGAVNRRVSIRKQEMLRQVADRWQSLTPAQQTNVVNAMPAP